MELAHHTNQNEAEGIAHSEVGDTCALLSPYHCSIFAPIIGT